MSYTDLVIGGLNPVETAMPSKSHGPSQLFFFNFTHQFSYWWACYINTALQRVFNVKISFLSRQVFLCFAIRLSKLDCNFPSTSHQCYLDQLSLKGVGQIGHGLFNLLGSPAMIIVGGGWLMLSLAVCCDTFVQLSFKQVRSSSARWRLRMLSCDCF